jgi:short-subunit dehydrogenase
MTDFSEFRRAIVIGASSGIGEAIVRQLTSAGCRVALVARRQDQLDRIARAVKESGVGEAYAHAHDVVNFDEIPGLFDKIVDELGGLDILIYAAGVMPEVVEGEYSFAKDRAMIEVNILGAMAWMNPAAAFFEAQRRGTICGISSIAGERGRRPMPGYCTSKAALSTYLEALRNRLSRYGVNVVTIKPGFVDTAMTKGKKGLFMLISSDEAARRTLSIAQRGNGSNSFLSNAWWAIAFVVRNLPSFIFRQLNF